MEAVVRLRMILICVLICTLSQAPGSVYITIRHRYTFPTLILYYYIMNSIFHIIRMRFKGMNYLPWVIETTPGESGSPGLCWGTDDYKVFWVIYNIT